MSEPVTWGTLSKAVDDLTTIVEQIAADILTHNQDVSAHGQSGEGVYTHRIAAILDHVDGSIDFKKLSRDKLLAVSCFESVDGWDVVGNFSAGILSATLRTAAVANDDSEAALEAATPALFLNYSKNPFFQTTFYMVQNTNVLAYIVAGAEPVRGDHDSFGFKISNANLYAYWTKSGVQHTQAIAGITTTVPNTYRAYCDSDNSKIYFYVNDILKYTATANYPDTNNDFLFYYYIKTLENALKHLHIMDFFWMMDR